MSDSVNPYQSPRVPAVQEQPLVFHGAFTETMLIYLKQASPWLRFIGILGFISAGISATSGFSFFAIVPLMNQFGSMIPGFDSFGYIFGAAFGGSMVLLCVGAGVLVFFPSLFIYRFGEKIRSYLRTGSDQDLELALKNNKSFWKFLGVLCIVQLAFIPVILVGAVIVGLVMAFV